VIRRKTIRKRLTRGFKAISRWCREHLHEPLREQVEQLGRKLKGHFGYYGLTGNYRSLLWFREGVIKIWRKWLARRGDPKGMSWKRMHKLLMPVRLMQQIGLFGLAERMGLLKLIPGRLGRRIPLLPPPAKPPDPRLSQGGRDHVRHRP